MANAKATWTGFVTFGILSVPVKLFLASKSENTSFNQVHECNGHVTKIKQQNYCSACESVVENDNLSRGFERGKNTYEIVTDAELNALKPGKSDSIEITNFVPLVEIDPIFFEKSYFIVPETAGRKAYELLFQTMGTSGLAGRAKYVSRGKEYNVFIRVYGRGIMMHTVFAANEVRVLAEYDTTREDVTVSEKELALCKTLLDSMVSSFDASTLTDEYEQKVQGLLASKINGSAPPAPGAATAAVDDLVATLNASLKEQAGKKAAAAETQGPKASAKKAKVA